MLRQSIFLAFSGLGLVLCSSPTQTLILSYFSLTNGKMVDSVCFTWNIAPVFWRRNTWSACSLLPHRVKANYFFHLVCSISKFHFPFLNRALFSVYNFVHSFELVHQINCINCPLSLTYKCRTFCKGPNKLVRTIWAVRSIYRHSWKSLLASRLYYVAAYFTDGDGLFHNFRFIRSVTYSWLLYYPLRLKNAHELTCRLESLGLGNPSTTEQLLSSLTFPRISAAS